MEIVNMLLDPDVQLQLLLGEGMSALEIAATKDLYYTYELASGSSEVVGRDASYMVIVV